MANGYDAAKAAEVNQLIEQGLTPEEAIQQAGIPVSEIGNYEYNPVESQLGQQLGPPTNSNQVNPASDPSQFPAYDDNGDLQDGFAINGETYYRGLTPPTQQIAGFDPYYDEFGGLDAAIDRQQQSATPVNNPYYGLTSEQLQQLGGADPTDPYIRARLGIPQLPGSELNPAGFATPSATGVPLIDSAAAAISKFGSLLSGFFGSSTKPAVTTQGTTTGTPPPAVVDTKAVAKDATAAKEQNPTLDAAAKENLTNIQEAGVNTAKAEEYIDINNRNIQANEQSQSQALEQQRQAQAIIDQNNAELADDNLPDDRRAQLEANNAAQYASIAENAAVIDEAQNNIDQATANNEQQVNSILENQYVAVENADAYRINTTGGVDENGDPVNDTANDPGFNDYGAPEYNAATDGPLTDTGTQELTEEETAALFNEAEAAVEPPPLAAPGEPGGPPLLTDAEIATLYGVTDTGEIGAITGTVITTDAARVALSDPEAIRAQEALNREVLENPATLPDVTVTELTDAEAAGLFEEAEAEPLVEAAGDVDPDADPELLAGPEEQEPFTDLAEPVDPDADPELLAGPEEQEPFTELAEPVDPDEDPELLAGPEEQEPFTDLAEPVDPDEDPELLGGPEEQEPFTDLAEPVDPDADPELLAGPEEEIDPFAPLQEPPDVDATEDPELLGGPTEEDTGPELLSGPEDVDPNEDPFEAARQQREEDNNAAAPTDADVSNSEEAVTKAKLKEAQNQATAQQRINQTTKGDWRVRLRLAPGSQYLYNSNDPGILKPLRTTDGVIFPYMPTIQTGYTANYDKYELTHSNFRGYYYKNSQVADVNITGTFTAQDTAEAEYMLAVIHFFRSATKMFYGQDPQRGAPPPLVYLSGLGEYQFNDHTCVISSFTYNLPNDVDYIAVTPNNQGINLSDRQTLTSSSPPSTLSAAINRLKNAGLSKGAKPVGPIDLGVVNQTVSGTGQTTYVPTKMDITITLLPINTRKQVSQEFSLNRYANGDLLKKGFW